MQNLNHLKRFTEERLGLAWVRGNKFIWDEEVFGPKPDGYDDLPTLWLGDGATKSTYIRSKMKEIEKFFGDMLTSKYWWLYELCRTEEQWKEWWMLEHSST